MVPVQYEFIAADDDFISLSQTTGAAGPLLLNGVGADYNNGWPRVILPNKVGRVISLTSGDDLSSIDFTITGTNVYGATITEVVGGPNNTTVESAEVFFTVSSIVADAAVTDPIEVGIGSTGYTNWIKVNQWFNPTTVGLNVITNGTINWDIEQTFDEVQETSTPNIMNNDDTNLVNQTGNRNGNYAFPCAYFHLVVNSSSGGSLTFTAIQAG